MMHQFAPDQAATFALYCYFPDRPAGQAIRLTRDELDAALGNLSDNYDGEIKDWFLKSFEVIFASDYITQFKVVIERLTRVLRARSESEALCWHAVIHGHLRDVILNKPPGERRVSIDDLRDLVHEARAAVFEASYAQVCGHNKYLKMLRDQYKSRTANVPIRERLFMIECDKSAHPLDLVEIVTYLRDRYRVGESPPPYVAFRGPVDLNRIKHALWRERVFFHDGFDYGGAEFSPSSIIDPPLPGYGVKLIDCQFLEQLAGCVTLQEVNDFYLDDPVKNPFPEARARHALIESHSDLKVIFGGRA